MSDNETPLMTEAEAAKFLRKSLSWLTKVRLYDPDKAPPVHYVGAKPLYLADELIEWVKESNSK